ncbi:MAG: GDSL-type esterase/lipase family protein [Acidobacteriota bacterium]|nr:GDSL-type esterase/lipase family protein [Acidobacteriota bacterium]
MQLNSSIIKTNLSTNTETTRRRLFHFPGPYRPQLFSLKPARTILFVLLFASVPFFIPKLRNALSLKGESYSQMLPDPRELFTFKASRAAAATIVPGAAAVEPPSSEASAASKSTDPCDAKLIADPGRVLDKFYVSLANTDAKKTGAITRITHYGDSPITNDGITGTTRRLLQERFGDAGHGFILIDRPWAWYGHQAITFSSGGGWTADSFMNPRVRDGAFGLGGVTFRADGPGKYARYAPASTGDTGKSTSRLEVYYLAQPGGGQFSASANGTKTETVSTDSESAKSGFHELKASQAGANTFEIKSLSGSVRLFGAVLENDGPGVVYDSLGVNGAYAGLLKSVMNEQHWVEQLQHRKPDLVVLNYGTNESEYASDDQMERYEKDLCEVVRRVHSALPSTPVLIITPMDRGKRAGGGKIITLESIPKIVDMQQRVARDTGCAFFNMFAAMGGAGTMAQWHAGKKHLVGADLTHPNAEGAETVGVLIFEALIDGYAKYRARTDTRDHSLVAQRDKK